MKYIILIALTITINSQANDSVIQLLEKNGVSTESFINAETVKSYSHTTLKPAIKNLITRLAFAQYATINHDSESGTCLSQGIVAMFKNPETFDSSVFLHCGGIFEGGGTNIDDSDLQHLKQHQLEITLVKQLAFDDCNQSGQVAQIPVFTAPQNLVDVIYNLSSAHHIDYDMFDGATFHCIKASSVVTQVRGQ